jgi:tRNA nucleotidyltransferase (CCA-adding enzyme)
VEIYLVGGAVRDALLGLPVRERDWVVSAVRPRTCCGSVIGRWVAIFRSSCIRRRTPNTRSRALNAKSAPGTPDSFATQDPKSRWEQDLKRRDLTINAMAQADDGTLIDPWGGTADLAARRLRHVIRNALSEVRCVFSRVARFAAQLAAFDFRWNPEPRS